MNWSDVARRLTTMQNAGYNTSLFFKFSDGLSDLAGLKPSPEAAVQPPNPPLDVNTKAPPVAASSKVLPPQSPPRGPVTLRRNSRRRPASLDDLDYGEDMYGVNASEPRVVDTWAKKRQELKNQHDLEVARRASEAHNREAQNTAAPIIRARMAQPAPMTATGDGPRSAGPGEAARTEAAAQYGRPAASQFGRPVGIFEGVHAAYQKGGVWEAIKQFWQYLPKWAQAAIAIGGLGLLSSFVFGANGSSAAMPVGLGSLGALAVGASAPWWSSGGQQPSSAPGGPAQQPFVLNQYKTPQGQPMATHIVPPSVNHPNYSRQVELPAGRDVTITDADRNLFGL